MWKSIKHKENKYIKYWLQSYLANVSDIYIGYKDEDGFIHEPIEYIKASDLPKVNYSFTYYEFNLKFCMFNFRINFGNLQCVLDFYMNFCNMLKEKCHQLIVWILFLHFNIMPNKIHLNVNLLRVKVIGHLSIGIIRTIVKMFERN